MDTVDRFGYCLAFDLISHAMDNKRTKLNKTAEIYVGYVKNLFSEVVKGLGSILNPSEGYYFVKNLKELVEVSGGKSKNASSEDVEWMISRFRRGIDNLETWLKDPQSFYEKNEGRVEELSTLCSKIRDLYTENYPVLECSDS